MTKILAIEDDNHVREIIWEILEAEDFHVIEAENGLIGLEMAIQEQPDLVICDVMMPGMDGLTVLKNLRENPVTQTVPFIFLTAKVTKYDMREGMDLGADDYLTKPFTRDELLGSVSSRLKKSAAAQQHSEEKLNELRNNLTRTLPHELLTPLNGILGFTSFLIDEYQEMEPTEIRQVLQDVKYSGERLYQLIQNFLLYAQLELVGKDPDRLKVFLQGETLSSHLTINAVSYEKAVWFNRVDDLHLKLVDTELSIDEHWFSKIVSELVENAFKFSEAGQPVKISSFLEDGQFILSVCDRGRGMTPEQISAVGAYVQFERKLYEQQGSGLGLAISQRLTQLNQGQLKIESIPGEETTVTVSFPLRS
ncbi:MULTISPECIES: hybrid sensor histidine kinase/response regulator [Planktothricoides]|uniref:histidine kinase n=2 Tax=Planktothricoides raciborskii TaxID=132608 RepID=A0AAU8J7E5_9CYAN|nr:MULTISPECIES: response regulator [Planktothricoides]KOR36034.1 chemotaxis protein CheY [Planktothricoides sp. SR001]MBD2545552.1 response regulator [Planktothricoides raciborskii FACHB-1370]MBD2583458.1 response regulator [Planktothricoides raciborskii FACHB-1261]